MDTPLADDRAGLLLNELRLAISFLDMADEAQDAETRARSISEAREAYAKATRMLAADVMYAEADWRKIEELTSEFRVRLHWATTR